MGLTGNYNSPVPDEAGVSIVKHAFNNGVTFFDTSDIYGHHTNEILVGKVISFLNYTLNVNFVKISPNNKTNCL